MSLIEDDEEEEETNNDEDEEDGAPTIENSAKDTVDEPPEAEPNDEQYKPFAEDDENDWRYNLRLQKTFPIPELRTPEVDQSNKPYFNAFNQITSCKLFTFRRYARDGKAERVLGQQTAPQPARTGPRQKIATWRKWRRNATSSKPREKGTRSNAPERLRSIKNS